MMVSITDRSERIVVFAIFGLAAALRIAAAIVLPDQSHALVDAIAYRDSAAQLLKSWHMVNLFQMPLYPFLIAIPGHSLGQLGADIALAVMLVWLVYALAKMVHHRWPFLSRGYLTILYYSPAADLRS